MNKLFILCGIPFSGKSTLAKAISHRFGHKHVDLDDIKFGLYGRDICDSDLRQKDWDIIYRKMYKVIEDFLKEGQTVIHDTGNFTKHERDLVRQIADRCAIEVKTIFVDTPKSIAYERLVRNRKAKTRFDVTDKDFEHTVAEMEMPKEDEDTVVFSITDNIDLWMDKYLKE